MWGNAKSRRPEKPRPDAEDGAAVLEAMKNGDPLPKHLLIEPVMRELIRRIEELEAKVCG